MTIAHECFFTLPMFTGGFTGCSWGGCLFTRAARWGRACQRHEVHPILLRHAVLLLGFFLSFVSVASCVISWSIRMQHSDPERLPCFVVASCILRACRC